MFAVGTIGVFEAWLRFASSNITIDQTIPLRVRAEKFLGFGGFHKVRGNGRGTGGAMFGGA
jgi:hypothetical protein